MKATVTITIEAESVEQVLNVVSAGLGTGVSATVTTIDPPETFAAPEAPAEEELTRGQKAARTRAANKAKKEASAKAKVEEVAGAEAGPAEQSPAEAPLAAPEAPTMDDLQAAIKAAAQNPDVGVAGVRDCLATFDAKSGGGAKVTKMTDLKEADYADAIGKLSGLAAGA